jgi:hypothetical protein
MIDNIQKTSEKDIISQQEIINFMMELPADHSIISHQHFRYSLALPAHKTWANVANACTQFYEGNQLTALERAKLDEEGRPHTVINRIKPIVNFLAGYFRQNRYDTKVLPGSMGSGSQEKADIVGHILKQIQERSQGDWLDAQIWLDGIITSRGFWDVRMDYTRNRLGEIVEAQENPFAILIDPDADLYNPNPIDRNGGWNYVMKSRWMSTSEIFMLFGSKVALDINGNERAFPLADEVSLYTTSDMYDQPSSSFGLDNFINGFSNDIASLNPEEHLNRHRKLVRVLDCQHLQLKRVTVFFDNVTGEEFIAPDGIERAEIQRLMELFRLRGYNISVEQTIRRMVRWTITAGCKVLWDRWSPYDDRFTIVPFFPYFRRGTTRGIIEDLIEPQREINRRRSAFLHIIMATANAGFQTEEGALTPEQKDAYENYGSTPGVLLEHKTGMQAPRRLEPAATPMAMKQAEIDSINDVKEIAGINDSALGNLDRVQSGRAIIARQKQAIVGAEMHFDNFAYSREIKARTEVMMIQKFYTEERIVRIRAEDGSEESLKINESGTAGEIKNNMSMGTYDIVIDESPMSASFLQGQFQEGLDMVQAGIPLPPDVLVNMSSIPNKEKVVKRMAEERQIAQAQAAIQNVGQRMQLGLPLDAPPPPIVVSDEAVTVSEAAPALPQPLPPPPMQPGMEQGAPNPQGMQPQPAQPITQNPETMTGGMNNA